ncbi:unnamed protein product, partial [Allacma fusca]
KRCRSITDVCEKF